MFYPPVRKNSLVFVSQCRPPSELTISLLQAIPEQLPKAAKNNIFCIDKKIYF